MKKTAIDFGIAKKYIYISLALFAFNMFTAVHTYVQKPEHSTFYQVGYILFPFFGAFIAGTLLGFILMMFPTKTEFRPEIKYTRSKVIGILIANAIFVFLYIYKLLSFYYPATNA